MNEPREETPMTDPMVGAGAQQGERHAEIALQRGEEFDEATLPAHLTQIPAGIGLPEFRDLTFEARPIAGLPPCFDRALIGVVPMHERQRGRELRHPGVCPRFRDAARITPHDDQPATVLGLRWIVDRLGTVDCHKRVRERGFFCGWVSSRVKSRSRCVNPRGNMNDVQKRPSHPPMVAFALVSP